MSAESCDGSGQGDLSYVAWWQALAHLFVPLPWASTSATDQARHRRGVLRRGRPAESWPPPGQEGDRP